MKEDKVLKIFVDLLEVKPYDKDSLMAYMLPFHTFQIMNEELKETLKVDVFISIEDIDEVRLYVKITTLDNELWQYHLHANPPRQNKELLDPIKKSSMITTQTARNIIKYYNQFINDGIYADVFEEMIMNIAWDHLREVFKL